MIQLKVEIIKILNEIVNIRVKITLKIEKEN